jgi:hypothetical protein
MWFVRSPFSDPFLGKHLAVLEHHHAVEMPVGVLLRFRHELFYGSGQAGGSLSPGKVKAGRLAGSHKGQRCKGDK